MTISSTTTTTNSATTSTTNSATTSTSSAPRLPPAVEKAIKILTRPSVHVSALMTTVLVSATQIFMNAALLSPLNSVRCSFWNKISCSTDEEWILNWYSFAKFHVFLLLCAFGSSTSTNSMAWLETRVGFLNISILLCTLTGGVFVLEHLNRHMAAFQAVVNVALILVLFYWISVQELQPGSIYLAQAIRSKSLSQSKSQRQKIAIPTVSLGLQVLLSIFRVVDMAFGSSKDGYLGDSSSAIYQSISNLAIADMVLVPVVMLFAFFLGGIEQHRAVLKGQVAALFVSQIILSSQQGELIVREQLAAGMAGTFASLVIAVIGAL